MGDSGVGKTSILVQFDTGKFHPSSFAATVGIGFTVSWPTDHIYFLLSLFSQSVRVCPMASRQAAEYRNDPAPNWPIEPLEHKRLHQWPNVIAYRRRQGPII